MIITQFCGGKRLGQGRTILILLSDNPAEICWAFGNYSLMKSSETVRNSSIQRGVWPAVPHVDSSLNSREGRHVNPIAEPPLAYQRASALTAFFWYSGEWSLLSSSWPTSAYYFHANCRLVRKLTIFWLKSVATPNRKKKQSRGQKETYRASPKACFHGLAMWPWMAVWIAGVAQPS